MAMLKRTRADFAVEAIDVAGLLALELPIGTVDLRFDPDAFTVGDADRSVALRWRKR